MSKRNALLIASVAALAVGGGFLFFRSEEAPNFAPAEPAPVASAPALQPGVQPPPSASVEAGAKQNDGAPEYDPEQDDGQLAFRADTNGRIVMNEKTRLDLERLHALYTPPERERKMAEIAATLPPEAARQLYQLMEQYQNYLAALYQVYPPDRELTSVEQGVLQIDGMHGLRVQYFGERATAAMFGAEEKLQRELYRQMENEKDPSLTLEEKAERAPTDLPGAASSVEREPARRRNDARRQHASAVQYAAYEATTFPHKRAAAHTSRSIRAMVGS